MFDNPHHFPQLSLRDTTPQSHINVTADGIQRENDNVQREKERKKVRGAWISFVSRIIAQFVGSAATIVLGLIYLQRYQPSYERTAPTNQESPVVVQPVAALAEKPPGGAFTLAVLPFDNYSGDPKQDHLANALTEALIAEMSRKPGLRVTSRTSSMRFRTIGLPLPEIARELAVKWIVEGSLVSSNGRVRAIAQLIDSSSDEHVWGAAYDRRLNDPLSLQADLATAIAGDLERAIARGRVQDGEGGTPAESGAQPPRERLDDDSPANAETSSPIARP
jgi:TolB-like protein